jgi:hypothetical protein
VIPATREGVVTFSPSSCTVGTALLVFACVFALEPGWL